mgnify:CR=1 FL=1
MVTRPRRIIPARAGFTPTTTAPSAISPDHPRSRGVYVARTASRNRSAGSSPLARGLRAEGAPASFSRGIIPARAGFTAARSTPPPRAGDHPRSRGVYPVITSPDGGRRGSSPLARGLLLDVRHHPAEAGIIPARAGFTHRSAPVPAGSGDHPRSRGVYDDQDPRLRPGGGIIPARAGFTPSSPPPWPPGADHPRSRGVYMAMVIRNPVTDGSSPLARGLRQAALRLGDDGRIIPARAGFTEEREPGPAGRRDHPRSRGVYTP